MYTQQLPALERPSVRRPNRIAYKGSELADYFEHVGLTTKAIARRALNCTVAKWQPHPRCTRFLFGDFEDLLVDGPDAKLDPNENGADTIRRAFLPGGVWYGLDRIPFAVAAAPLGLCARTLHHWSADDLFPYRAQRNGRGPGGLSYQVDADEWRAWLLKTRVPARWEVQL